MSPQGITFRPYRDGDERAINEAFNEVFGLERPLAEWHWKFAAGPEGRWVMVAMADDGAVLAQYAAVPARMQVDGASLRSGQIVDVFSRPAARQGLAAGRAYLGAADAFIARWCNPADLGLCFGFPSDRPLRLGVSRLGYAAVPPQPVPVWTRGASRRGRLLAAHSIRIGFDATAADTLWERSRGRYPIALVRDAAWLARRFTGRAGVSYVHVAACRRGAVRALAVVRPGVPAVSWAELLWDGEDPRALAALDRAVAAIARRAGAARIEMWLAGDSAAARAFSELGWAVAEHPLIRQVIHPFHPAVSVDSVAGRTYLTMGDSDLV